MIPLLDTADLIRVITGSAVTTDVVATYADASTAVPPVVQGFGRTVTAITTATTTTVLAGQASTVRNLHNLHIRNKHASSSVTITVTYEDSGTAYELYKVTLLAGQSLEYIEELGFYVVAAAEESEELVRILDADATGQNINTTQPWFPTNGSVTVAAATTYHMNGELSLSRTAGTTSHTTSIEFGGTATITSIYWGVLSQVGETDALLPVSRVMAFSTAAVVAKAASTTASEKATFFVHGILRTNAAGTFIPRFTYSAAPGGAPTIRANSHFELTPIGPNTLTAIGTWS